MMNGCFSKNLTVNLNCRFGTFFLHVKEKFYITANSLIGFVCRELEEKIDTTSIDMAGVKYEATAG